MRKFFTIFLFLFTLLFSLQAQEIKVHQFQGGYRFTQGQQIIKLKDLALAVNADRNAEDLAISAKANKDLSIIFSFVGGLFVGAPIGKAIAGGKPNWLSAAVGGGLIIGGLQFHGSSKSKAKRAVDIYNSTLSFNEPPSSNFKLKIDNNGVSLTFQF